METEPITIPVDAQDNASGVLSKLADGIGIAFGEKLLDAVGEGIGFVTEQLGKLIEKSSEAQDTETLFNAVLDNSPLAGYKNQLMELADQYSKTTKFSDDTVIATETVLARYTNLGQDVMPQVLRVSTNMATLMGQDLPEAGQTLGKALEDIGGGSLTLLARTRLLSKEQKTQAEEMAKAGNVAGAQTMILGILDDKTNGLAEKMAGTYSGKLTIFNNTIERMQEIMGGPLLDAITPIITWFTVLAQQAAPLVEGAFTTLIEKFTGAQGALAPFQGGLDKLGAWWNMHGPEIQAIATRMIAQIAPEFEKIGNNIIPVMVEELSKFGDWVQQNTPMIEAGFQGAANFVVGLAHAFELLSSIAGPIISTLVWETENLISVLSWAANLVTVIGGAHPMSNTVGTVAHHAMGGDASGWSVVGEQGPELVRLPSGSHVFSNPDSQRMVNNGNGNNQEIIDAINRNQIDYNKLARLLRDAMLQVAR